MSVPLDTAQIFLGTLIQCKASGDPRKRELEITRNAAICVNSGGTISAVLAANASPGDGLGFDVPSGCAVTALPRDRWILPGFIDLHYHAPQLPLAGKKMDVPLEQWLHSAVPLEARCSDPLWAASVYDRVVHRTLTHGSTTVVYYASVHGSACRVLANMCRAQGQRALVGKVCMDNSEVCGCGEGAGCSHVATTQDNIDSTRAFVAELRDDPLVRGIITPRFVPACSPALLDGLGALARELDTPVQTHAWESDWQVQYGVEKRGGRDLALLHGHGLDAPRGLLLAHAVHADESDVAEMATSRSIGVAHCPLSNAFYANGIMPARHMLDAGVSVGLGTDVGGAWSSSILDACRQAVVSSRILQDGTGMLRGGRPCPGAAISHVDAFWMATVGGARALGWPGDSLRVGMPFDALVVSVREGNVDVWPDIDTLPDQFQKFMACGDDRNIRQVWVQGRRVIDKDKKA